MFVLKVFVFLSVICVIVLLGIVWCIFRLCVVSGRFGLVGSVRYFVLIVIFLFVYCVLMVVVFSGVMCMVEFFVILNFEIVWGGGGGGGSIGCIGCCGCGFRIGDSGFVVDVMLVNVRKFIM